MGDAVTQLLRIFVPVLIALVLKWAAEIWMQVREKNPRLAELLALAGQVGYAAAEEYFRDREADGSEKLDYALDRANEYLQSFGINVDLNVVRDSIINYGVSQYKFSWTKKDYATLSDVLDTLNKDEDEGTVEDDAEEEPEGA